MVEAVVHRHRFANWRLEDIQFDPMSSTYALDFSYPGITVKTKIPSEMVDDPDARHDVFKRRSLKKLLKEKLLPNTEIED